MDALLLWKLCERVTLFQAVMLGLGYDPQDMAHYKMQSSRSKPKEYEALLAALKSGLHTKCIQGVICEEWDDQYERHIEGTINPDSTMVDLKSVGQFLQSKGIDNPLCGQASYSQLPDYLNPAHPCYAPKLAAAIQAWLAVVADPKALHKKTPKAAMEKWLRLNAKTYGLTSKDGSPNALGIDEICKVANWKPKGGAAKSSGDDLPPVAQRQEQTHPPLNYIEENNNLDEEIPF